jgi:hypothetical protein
MKQSPLSRVRHDSNGGGYSPSASTGRYGGMAGRRR